MRPSTSPDDHTSRNRLTQPLVLHPPPRRPGKAQIRRRRLALFGAIAGLISVVLVAVWVSGGFANTHRVKIVHVVVVSARPTHGPSLTVTAPRQPHHHRSSLPAASAGTNGSFTPPESGGASPSSHTTSVLAPNATTSFANFVRTQPGRVQVAIASIASGRVSTLGGNDPAPGWSTTKVAVLTALIKARGASGLTPAEQQLAETAITESDNQSILDLFSDLEKLKGGLDGASLYIQQLFRESGDDRTIVTTAPPPPGGVTTFGQTAWSPSESVKFFQSLARACLIDSTRTGYVLNLMERIIPSESWGFGSASFGVPVAFKGGWGPESYGYLVRQSAIIDPGSSKGVAATIVAYPPAGANSFEIGTEMLTATARWLSHEVRLIGHPRASCA